MMLRSLVGLSLVAILAGGCAGSRPSAPSSVPPDTEILRILAERVDGGQSVGIVVGAIDPSGRRVVSYGGPAKGDMRPLDGDTVFEIGSITKVFTSLLLADMARRGEVALTDPAAEFLPPGATVPERGGRSITLEDLSTHTSGLPRLPENFHPRDTANPYADYTIEQLYRFLSDYRLTRDIGAQYEYSNLGGGLLGHVLSLRAGRDYEALVRARITDPLGMASTRIALPPDLKARLATGHDPAMNPTANWDLPTLPGAGALRSSANDMLVFLAASLGYTQSPLAPAMAAMLEVRRPTGTPGTEMALGWHITNTGGKEIVWHNGGTGGYRAFVGFDPQARIGVVALSNAGTVAGVDDIGWHLLDPRIPLLVPPRQHTETTVDPELFDGYVGRYELAPGFILTVIREGDRLFVQATGQQRAEVFSEGPKEYFYKVVDAQIIFETDDQGRATALVLHQNGVSQRAVRIE